MIIAFTGTRNGMTWRQQSRLRELLLELNPDEFRHGDCVGSDTQAHAVATALSIQVVIHPPTNSEQRSYCEPFKTVLPPRPYLLRNRDMVLAADILIAAPRQSQEEQRSGTWATIREAKKRRKPVLVLEP